MAGAAGSGAASAKAPVEPEGLGESHAGHDQIAILDFGSQYSHLIARRIRELGVYCEMHSCLISAEDLFAEPKGSSIKGVIFSGGPFSVYEDGAPHVDEGILKVIEDKKLPLLGICYGFYELMHRGGGKVEAASEREYGHAVLDLADGAEKTQLLGAVLEGQAKAAEAAKEQGAAAPAPGVQVWMSHGDKVTALAAGWETLAKTRDCAQAVAWCPSKRRYGIQFHPEVSHTPCGLDILRGFVLGECTCGADWSMSAFLDEAVKEIRDKVGEEAHVIGAVSGGVDSTVAAVLMNRAIGKRFHAVMVDNGLLRLDEAAQCKQRLGDECGVDITVVDASERFLGELAGVDDPERKRKIIGNTFIHIFEAEAEAIDKRVKEEAGKKEGGESLVQFLLQGTLYPDVIESVSFKGPSATIKSHHNVGGLLDHMKLGLIEPLRELFKDEVRALGMEMGLPRSSVFRHPFPGPGLAIRVLGAVSKESCDILRQADKIYLDELHASGEYDKIGQAFAVLLPCKSVGVMGDGRTYEQVVALRAAATTDFMTADWHRMPYEVLAKSSTRIINEVKGVNRVCYDVSSKPPATIEWE